MLSIRLSLYSIPLVLTALGMLVLGIGVLFRERASDESRAFFALSLAVTVWQLGFAGMYSAADPTIAMTWARGAYLGIPLIAPALLGFTASILRLRQPSRRLVLGAWGLAVLFVVLFLATDHIIVGMYHYPWGYYPRYGLLGLPYLLFFSGTLGFAMVRLCVEFREAEEGTHRARIRWLIIAFGVAYVAVIDYLPTFGVPLYPFGHVFVLLFQLLAAWTIARYRLVDLTPSFAADQILSTMADALIVVDTRGQIRILNNASCAVLGVEREALIGQPVEALVASGSPDGGGLRSLCDGTLVRGEELRLVNAAGDELDMSVSASPLTDSQGYSVGTVFIARDVKERIHAERMLREREQRFRSLIENITDAIVVVDAEGMLAFASASLDRMIGCASGEWIGRNMLALLHPDDRPGFLSVLREVAVTPGHAHFLEFRVVCGLESWRYIEASATNPPSDSAIAGIIVIFHDATDRRAAEAALRESEERLQHSQRIEAVGRLAGGVAHDFNNLLTVIIGHARAVLDGLHTEAESGEALEEVVRAADHAASLTRQLLAFSRKQVLHPCVLDLNEVVLEIERLLRRLLGADLRLEIRLQQNLSPVLADRTQLEQVLINLITNARDAMPNGGYLVISTENVASGPGHSATEDKIISDGVVCLAVRDTGVGMTKRTQEQMFEPFFTTKEGKGTGLGLSTVYGIVKQSGGWITVDSAPNKGTVFRVYLPRTELAAATIDVQVHDRPIDASGTVLVVDDNPAVRGLVRKILDRTGYRVAEASSGSEALAIAASRAEPFDLLLSDVGMPEMSGLNLAAEFLARDPSQRILLMSGNAEDELAKTGGIDPRIHFLEKPFLPQELLSAVEAALTRLPGRNVATGSGDIR